MRVLLPAIGQSYEHPDIPLSAQSTKNWFPEINQESQTVLSLQPYPGTKTFSSKAGIDRGMTVWGNQLYKVTDKALYSVNTVGVQTSIGTIDGVGRCTFPASATILVIVTSGFVYQYDGNTLSEITDVDLEIPNYGAYLNNQWIYQGSRARFCVSEAGQPANINGLNYASAESEGDDLVRPYVFNQILYLFGEKNTEAWYNSGQGRPPFDRVDGGIIQKGLGAADSLDNNDQSMYFLGDDRIVYQMSGSQVQPISTIPISTLFDAYEDVSTAVGFCFNYHGQEFYQITVSDQTWLYSQDSGGWSQITYSAKEIASPVSSYAEVYGKKLIAIGGDIVELSDSATTFDGEIMIRERITGQVSGEIFGAAGIGLRVFMSRLEIIIKGIPDLDVTPKIMVSWSDDSGYTFSNERIVECGQLGNYQFKAITHQLGSFYERVFKIRISDNSRYSLHKVTGDVDVGA